MISHLARVRRNEDTTFGPAEAAALERALRMALALRGLVITVFGAVLPAAMHSFGLSNAQASILPAVSGLGAATAALSAGALTDRRGARRAMLAMAWALLLASLILWGAPAWSVFVAGAFMINWGAGGMATVTSVLLARAYRGRSGAAFNRNFLFVGVGSLTSPLLVGAALALFGSWRWAFAVLSFSFAGLLVAAWRAPYPPPEPQLETSETDARGDRPWWRERTLALCAIALVCYVGAEVGLTTWAARFLASERGAAVALSATVVSIFWGGMILGRYGFSRLLRPGNEKRLVGVAGAVGAGAVLAFIRLPGVWGPILAVAVGGVAFGGMWPTIMSYAAVRAGGRAGAASGLLIALGFLGALVVPAVIGVLSTWIGLSNALGVVILAIASSAALFYLA